MKEQAWKYKLEIANPHIMIKFNLKKLNQKAKYSGGKRMVQRSEELAKFPDLSSNVKNSERSEILSSLKDNNLSASKCIDRRSLVKPETKESLLLTETPLARI